MHWSNWSSSEESVEEMILLWLILGAVLLADLAIYLLRERIARFFASHGFPSGHSESLPDLSDLKKWSKP
jgi:hypothetical protein